MTTLKLHHGDCLNVLHLMEENSVDAVVTDPPYELGFMGKSWDASGIAFNPETWRKVMRVLKPGGHIVAFGAPKNYHRLACAIEDAGFEVRDSLMWVFGSGFPKSADISKHIDKAAGAEREVIGVKTFADGSSARKTQKLGGNHTFSDDKSRASNLHITAPATDAAREWQGWGTALKPAYEPIVLARKPLSEGTVAANVLRWGTGAINVDACRVKTGETITNHARGSVSAVSKGIYGDSKAQVTHQTEGQTLGRYPANLAHDGSDEVLEGFPYTKSGSIMPHHVRTTSKTKNTYGQRAATPEQTFGDEGSAARFFYCAKANKHDRAGSKHPTVKPVSLMRWLVRMVTPPGGTILDPFAGSGTTGQAAIEEGFNPVLIERENEYVQDIQNRMKDKCDVELIV